MLEYVSRVRVAMLLDGLHHITMITGDAPANVRFYADVLGLRLVKKTVNFDQPDAYHLYFGDERGSPGSILTWFEFRGAGAGRPGAGMIHLIQLGVAELPALDFWAERLDARGYGATRHGESLRFRDDDGLALELVLSRDGNAPLRAAHPEVPSEHAIVGIEGARAYARASPDYEARAYAPASAADAARTFLTETLGFASTDHGGYRLAGEHRRFHWAYDPAPGAPGVQGAGSVHHIAWACEDADQLAWQQRVRDAGSYVTDVLDRDYFQSIYFREPRGVLFEIATLLPGFAVDEDPDHLGEALRLPRQHEHLRARLEERLAPVENPRAARTST